MAEVDMRAEGETLGQRIKRLRIARDMTQPELAAAVGVDHATISRWETGKTEPRAGAMRRALAEALGVSPTMLVTGRERDITPPLPLAGRERRRAILKPLRDAIAHVERMTGENGLDDLVSILTAMIHERWGRPD